MSDTDVAVLARDQVEEGAMDADEQDAEERSPRAKNEKEAKIRDAIDLLSSRQRQEKIEEVDRRLRVALAQ